MIELHECIDRCFAELAGECDLLKEVEVCDYTCPWYKPRGCKDWVRLKYHGQEMLCPPEEYERKFKNEDDNEPKAVYWRIKVCSTGKK